jgi:hypothetical protein
MKKYFYSIAILFTFLFISCSEEATGPNISQMELDIKNYEIRQKEFIAGGIGFWNNDISQKLNYIVDSHNLLGKELSDTVAIQLFNYVQNQLCYVYVTMGELKYTENKDIYNDLIYGIEYNKKSGFTYSSYYNVFYIDY